ncbi:MAG: hypothetical protein HKP10_07715 [Kiritimatiellales bacterium]|nr:hypothetical protein [Pontiella sp.]NNJ71156.1 hypothetical protein [Kiritimatiellales bacterium]
MKKTALILAIAMAASFATGESAIKQFNDLDYGTLSGRLQSLSMYRDYEAGNNNHATTLGLQLDYRSPTKSGWSAGASYVGAGVLDSMVDGESSPGDRLLGNGRVNLLNEAYLSYHMEALGLTNTTAYLGRRAINGEVFRYDDFRQKKRAIEAVMIESAEFHKTRIIAGHAWEMSNWIDAGNLWKFDNFDNYGTDGVTWAEIVNNCVEDLEVAVFDAMAQDLANLIGARAKWSLSEDTAVLAYLRHERDIGDGADLESNAFGLSVAQAVGDVKLEGGFFGVGGDSMAFQEVTTGINHALGSSMMIYSGQFSGGAETLYLKAVTKLKETGTVLYGLYNYTLHDKGKTDLRQAQELNIVIKQSCPVFDNLTVAFKGGIGTRDGVNGDSDTTATDARLFVTYTF